MDLWCLQFFKNFILVNKGGKKVLIIEMICDLSKVLVGLIMLKMLRNTYK